MRNERIEGAVELMRSQWKPVVLPVFSGSKMAFPMSLS